LLAGLSDAEVDTLDRLLSRLQTRAEQLVAHLDAGLPKTLRHRGRMREPHQ
jgi:hypothetical protein